MQSYQVQCHFSLVNRVSPRNKAFLAGKTCFSQGKSISRWEMAKTAGWVEVLQWIEA